MISTRIVSRSSLTMIARRSFSSDCAAAEKLRGVFEEYRQQNYSYETPTRFKKDLLKAIADNDRVPVDRLNSLLVNIGRDDKLLSDEELSSLLEEAGAKGRSISAAKMLQLV